MDDRTIKTLKQLPKIDEILLILEREDLARSAPRDFIVDSCRFVVAEMRSAVMAGTKRKAGAAPDLSAESAAQRVKERIARLHVPSLRRVVNATGVILHTNLGRAPLCEAALEKIVEVSRGYSNVEFNLATGKRGLRYDHVRDILCAITGAEDVLVVNNNAAAVLLVLNTLAAGKEAIVSRGELIEIGGAFRIPEVMEKSGAVLREVGTTNRTRFADYAEAISDQTGMILKVHASNFRIAGFTEEVELTELVELGMKRNIAVMNDLGSGCFIDVKPYGFDREPTVQEALKSGVDIVTFSGDKLLGGPQAGVVLGRKEIIEKVRQNPLNRALRIDKLTLAALEATMRMYLAGGDAVQAVPAIHLLTTPVAAIEKKARKLLRILNKLSLRHFAVSLKKGYSMAGGGSLPTQEIPTILIGITPRTMSAGKLGDRLRFLDVPVIARVADEKVLFDLRTVDESEFVYIREGLKEIDDRDGS
ncbi:MAG: L-seryl-tRNA(Sec) selenium transferase [Deltaproteobacteria bacterium]|nr:L-seryl-tRNA(Sec) selenium transferase [Deltaproteobacteria bacterium]